ncbi:MAG: biopolymer transporter ExbD [Pseudomonadota bacterium]
MQLQNDQEEEPDINLTSLIDVVFLLLIFFMVSSTFERQALLRVDLPQAATSEEQQLPDRIELVITADGDYFIGEQLLVDQRKATLELALRDAFDVQPDAVLVIRGDAQTQHGLVVRAMDAAAAQGISRLSIATVTESAETEPES